MNTELLNVFLLAFGGGALLNFMPCVFPILSLKIMSLVRQRTEGREGVVQDCLFYAAGVLLSMLCLTGALLVLRATGSFLGWGYQLQSPMLVTALLYITFLMGLSFSGWYEVHLGAFWRANPMGGRYVESFMAGVLSTVIGTPCAAPFMVSAVSVALLQPGWYSLFVFQFMGLGIVFPYLMFALVPGAVTLLPKPGKWTEYLKQFLAFPMYLTSVWLLHVLVSQKGVAVLFPALCSVVALVLLIWLLRCVAEVGKISQGVALLLTVAMLVFSSIYIGQSAIENPSNIADPVDTQFSSANLQRLLDAGENVFVAVGAEWCLLCKTNEVLIGSEKVREVFRAYNVKYVQASWTKMDPEVTDYLRSVGYGSVPCYVLYVKGKRVKEQLPTQLLSDEKLVSFLVKNLEDR